MNIDDPGEARRVLLGTTDQLRRALHDLNCYGDTLDGPALAHQRDGSAYGEVYDGFRILVGVLFPDDGVEDRAGEIISTMFESDVSVEEAARHVADRHSPMWGYGSDEVRDSLRWARRDLDKLDRGVLDPVTLVGEHGADTMRYARDWLNKRVTECEAALRYRGEDVTE